MTARGEADRRLRRALRCALPVLAPPAAVLLASIALCQQPAPQDNASLKLRVEQNTRLPVVTSGASVTISLRQEPPAPEPLPPGQAQPCLSLADLEQIALRSNPSIGRAASLVGAARGDWVQAGLMPNPSVGYEGQQIGSGGQAEQHGVLLSQEVVRPSKLKLSRAVADQEVARAQREWAVQQQRVMTDVRIAFYQALLAQRQIDLTSELVDIGQQGARAAEQLFQAKEVGRVDVLQAQLELENARILATNAYNRHRAAWQSLAAVVGEPNLPPQSLVGDAYAAPAIFDLHETLWRIKGMSPEIGVAAANIERARFALERARIEPRPNLSVQGLINWQDNGIGGKPDAGLMATVPVPLWNRNQGAILRSEQELAAAQMALRQVELDLQNRLAPTFERYANARNQVDRYRSTILPTARQSLELTRQLYAAGEISYVNLLTVQRTFSQTNLAYLEALRDLRTAEAEIDGLLLSGSLQVR